MQKEKAKRFLAGSLLSLMEQKPYEKINISEICSSAFLSRPSFYKYFVSKDELLEYQFRTLMSAELYNADGDAAARLAECLVRLAGYTQVISEQRLLALLLPELAEMLEADASPRGMCSTCFMYLSLLFAVRNAPGLRTDVIVRYWREVVSGVPDSVRVPPGKYADEALERNAALIADALLAQLESGAELTQIQVKKLTAAANVNRSSFYRCFADMRDLFTRCLRTLIFKELASGLGDDESMLEHYRPQRTLLSAAWRELGLERFTSLYTSVLNEVTELPDDDIAGDQLYIYRLQSACFAAKRTALLYCFV